MLALLFILVAATIEAVNVFNYMTPLFTLTLPERREERRKSSGSGGGLGLKASAA